MKNSTKLVALIFFGLFVSFFTGIGQRATLALGEENKTRLSTDYSFTRGKGTDVIQLTMESHKHGMGGFASYTQSPILTSYNKRLEMVKQKELPELDKNTSFDQLIGIGKKVFFFTNQYDKDSKSTSFFCQSINVETLEPEGTNLALGKFEMSKLTAGEEFKANGNKFILLPGGRSNFDQQVADYTLSKDSSKILMSVSAPRAMQENEKYYLAVYNNAMTKLWDRTIELPYKGKFVDLQSIAVTNNGEVCMVIKHYETEKVKEKSKKDGEDAPAYSTQLLVFEKDNPTQISFTLNTEGKFVHSLIISDSKDGNATIFGLYQQKPGGNIQGFFTANMNTKTKEQPVVKLTAFPESLVEQVKADKQSDKKDIAGFSNDFKIVKTLEREGGSTDYLLEYYASDMRTYGGGGSGSMYGYNMYYTYGDIIDINIGKASGNPIYTKIPRYQICQDILLFGGLQATTVKDKLLVFFNDHEDNIDKKASETPRFPVVLGGYKGTVLQMATIDNQGGIKRVLIASPEDKKMASVNTSIPLDNQTIAINAFDGFFIGKSKVVPGIITIK